MSGEPSVAARRVALLVVLGTAAVVLCASLTGAPPGSSAASSSPAPPKRRRVPTSTGPLRSPWAPQPGGTLWFKEKLPVLREFVDVPNGTRFAAMLTAAFEEVAQRDDKCTLPITCQLEECSAAILAEGAACEQYELPQLAPELEAMAKLVVLEVGTNLRPESTKLAARRGRMVVAAEPLQAEGTVVWARGLAHVLVSSAVGLNRTAAQLSVESTMSVLVAAPSLPGNASDTTSSLGSTTPTQRAAVLPAADIIDAYVPANATAQFFVIDAQGFDLYVALSAGREGLKRFTYVIFECQEVWPEHPFRINSLAPTCLESVDAITRVSGHRLAGCIPNAAIFEFNCLMVNPAFERVAKQLPAASLAPERSSTIDWRAAAGMLKAPGLEQLTALLGKADGADAYELMCPITHNPSRASRKCRVRSAKDLRGFPKEACLFWEYDCAKRTDANDVVHCFRGRQARCGAGGACQPSVLGCAGSAACVMQAVQPCRPRGR